ncbi:MAG: hypothetical protein SGBAC_007033 [Bacillariaceae sp.]
MPADGEEKSLFDASEASAFAGSKSVPCDSSTMGLRTSARKRSSLFDTIPSSRSRNEKTNTTCAHERLQATLVLESHITSSSSSTQQVSKDRQEKRQKSFFGAVMHRSEYLEPAVDTINRSPNTPDRIMIEGESNLVDDIGNSVMSPTGKTIMGFVNNFGNSPFRFQSPKNLSLVHGESNAPAHADQAQRAAAKRQTRSGTSQNDLYSNMDQEWLEIPIVEDQLAFLDFSLRTTVLVECNTKQEISEVSSDLGKRLTDLVKGDKAQYGSKHLGKLHKKISTTSSMYRGRWQEAIRSIFLSWCCGIKALVDGDETEMTASDNYFYCIAKDHVALFRVDEVIGTDLDKKFEPRVIVSNITTEFKVKLQHEGMKDIRLPSEEAAEGTPPGEKDYFAPMSPNIKAELEALRRAQALGENAGADFRVKSNARRVKKPAASRAATPCRFCGFDNVSCFFEVYLNTYGQMHTMQSHQQALPVLLSDKVGPFLHSTLETLEFHPIKTVGAQSLHVEGFIMPSAFRNLVASMTKEVTNRGTALHLQRNIFEDKEEICYMLIETSNSGEVSPVSRKFADSGVFNGWNTTGESRSATSKTLECEMGQCIKRLVWEAKSPEVLACNFEQRAPRSHVALKAE